MLKGTQIRRLARNPQFRCRHISKIAFAAQVMRPSLEAIVTKTLLGFMPTLNQSAIRKLPFQRGVYVPREEDTKIEECFRELSTKNPSNQINVIMLHGPGGYGKSCSAGNFVRKIYISKLSSAFFRLDKNDNPKWSILKAPIVKWTLDASNEKSLLESYCDLAQALGLQREAKRAKHHISMGSRTSSGRQHHNEVSHHVKEDNAMKQALESIYEPVMEKLDEFPGFVLIVDGAKSESATLAKYWPKEGEHRRGKGLVVITTQDPSSFNKGNGQNDFLRKVSVSKMKEADAMNLLEKSSGIKTTGHERKCAEDIVVKELDCNPQDIAA